VVSAWHSTFLAQSIRDGKLNTLLIKPINPIVFDTTNNIAEKVLKMFFLLPMVIVGALIFNAQLHSTGIRAVLFILSLVLAAIFRFITEHLIGILGFWIEEVVSIKNLIDASSLAFGGWIVPLFLFSTQLQEILKWLPFYYYGGFSLEILVSPMPYINIYIGILFQIGWTLLISMLTIFLWKKGVKKYSAYGG
jgi:ABC-2 type transport system permease protein